MCKSKTLWILTEECPRDSSLRYIVDKFIQDKKFCGFVDHLRIIPILEAGKFTFTYEVKGFHCTKFSKILIKIVSGSSSFVDFLVFYQDGEPTQKDIPLYCIEETKTDDSESRNTGVYQRCTKFVFLEHYYPQSRKIMLYNLRIPQKAEPTETNIFGTRLLLTLGVEILGKKLDSKIFRPFKNLEELIKAKAAMRKPPKGNVRIAIKKWHGKIYISGRLFKANALGHDPNIGALSIICAVIRHFGWSGDIILLRHGLQQGHMNQKHKFVILANKLCLALARLNLPQANFPILYWRYDMQGEKLGTIFMHIAAENFAEGKAIFENHAGCEKGYFITKSGAHVALAKYEDRVAYKAGNKAKIIAIPDLILQDNQKKEIINIEGKKYANRAAGIAELAAYDAVERLYINEYYPDFSVIRTVILYGGSATALIEIEIGFLLNSEGEMILGVKAPALFGDAIKNLSDFWN